MTFYRGKRTAGLARPDQTPAQGSCTGDTAAWVKMLNVPIVTDDNGSITAYGELDICTSLEFDFNFTALPLTVNSLLVAATIAGDLHVGVVGEYSRSIDQRVDIMPALQSDPILVDVFGIPIVLTAQVTFFVGASGTVNGSFSAGVDQTASFTLGLSYSGGQFSPIETWTQNFTEDPLVLDASLTAKVYAGAEIGVTVDEVLTPSVSPDAFLQLYVDPFANPWWTLSGGVELSACSVALEIFGIGEHLDCPDSLIQQLQYSLPIKQAAGGFLPSDTTPSITSITPGSVTAGSSGQTLTLTGTKFVPGATVNFNGANLPTTFVTTSQITVVLPEADLTTAGTFPMTVTDPAPQGGTSPSLNFTVQPRTGNPQPSITSLSPASAVAGSSSLTLTINGSGFIASSSVTFNGLSRTSKFVSASQLSITLSSSDLAKAGTFPVVVTNPPPGGGSSKAVSFTLQPATNPLPTITNLSPASAPVGGSPLTLTITGSGFIASSSVTFNALPHTTTFVSASQLSIALSGSDLANAGTFPVVVTNPSPGGGTSQAVDFTVIASNSAITITSVSKVTASYAPPIVIGGSGFGSFPYPLPTSLPYYPTALYSWSPLIISDNTQNWRAGGPWDTCTLSLHQWSDSSISLVADVNEGLGFCPLAVGDQLAITVWNPESSGTSACDGPGETGQCATVTITVAAP